MHLSALAVAFLIGLNVVLAAPTTSLTRRQAITQLTTSQIAAYKPFTYFASAAYCNSSSTLSWSCGANCAANSGFQPIASGGDGSSVQFWYVGYDSAHNTIIVAHQGTNPQKILPLITDINIAFTSLNFPGISSDIKVHEGFAKAQQSSSASVLSAVKTGFSKYNTTSVTVVGHSLGGAISLIDAVFLHSQIPNAQVTFYGYGNPRVGNQQFANYIDTNIKSFTRITNLDDPMPILPGIFLGFHHPSGEVHIEDNLSWKFCPGQDNSSNQCSVGDIPSLFQANLNNHDGLYDGVTMGC